MERVWMKMILVSLVTVFAPMVVHASEQDPWMAATQAEMAQFISDFKQVLEDPSSSLSFKLDFARCDGIDGVRQETNGVIAFSEASGVVEFLQEVVPIDANKWHYCYGIYQCLLTGALVAGETEYEIEIDAGGTGIIKSGSYYIRFGHPKLDWCGTEAEIDTDRE